MRAKEWGILVEELWTAGALDLRNRHPRTPGLEPQESLRLFLSLKLEVTPIGGVPEASTVLVFENR